MPEPKQHADNRNWLESLGRKIPGFRGYLEKAYRRESDELQRKWLSDQLQRSKRGLNEYARSLAEAAQVDQLPQIERLRSKLDRLIGRITSAMQGYSGVFDLVRVQEDELDRLYQHDVGMMQEIESLADGLEKLPASAQPVPEVVSALVAKIEAAEQSRDRREDILKGLE
jgi:hypothetical protein